MAKRFTDTDIWDQDWYIALPNKYKILWNYIKDKCDNCGVWRPNKEMIQRIILEPLDLNEFLTLINIDKCRILALNNGRWFLKHYFYFQYGAVFNPHSPVHRGALKQLLLNNIHIKELSSVSCGKLADADLQTLKSLASEYPDSALLIIYGYSLKKPQKDRQKGSYHKDVEGEKERSAVTIENGIARFRDGSSQLLGPDQLYMLHQKCLSAGDIKKGHIY